MRCILIAPVLVATSLLASASVRAQEQEPALDEGIDPLEAKKQQDAEKATGDRMPGEKVAAPPTEDKPDPNWDPKEDPSKAYRFIGMRFRNLIVPKFMINLFAEGGGTVNAFTFGPEFTTRKDHIEFNVALSFADYSMDPLMFKGKDDGDEAIEKVSSTMKLLYLTLDILYEIPLDQKGRFALLVGGGVGLAPVFGNLYRNQAYPKAGTAGSPDDPTQWDDCRAPGTPSVATGSGQPFCDDSNKHFVRSGTHSDQNTDTQYDEPSWFNGGSKPSIMPWISLPQVSFRYKPIRQFQTRVDVGFSITGFFFGMNAGYAL
ncbi:MAG: hypothetical protein WKG00_13265 [Polyangiaceae bacterium]